MVQCPLGTVPQQKFFTTGVVTECVRWGYGGPRTLKNVKYFVGRHDELSRAAKMRAFKENQRHCGQSGVISLQNGFHRIEIGWGSLRSVCWLWGWNSRKSVWATRSMWRRRRRSTSRSFRWMTVWRSASTISGDSMAHQSVGNGRSPRVG